MKGNMLGTFDKTHWTQTFAALEKEWVQTGPKNWDRIF